MFELVSIIMPSFNTGEYIKEAIYSILNQTYSNFELIIVDDKSSDNSVDIIKSITDNRIKLLINETNKGAAYSRNRALKEAKGRWIAFLDSDDIWLPTKLEKQINFMINNNYYFSYCNYGLLDSNGSKSSVYFTGPKVITHRGFLHYSFCGCLTVMYERNIYENLSIPSTILKRNDYALWLKLSEKCNCYLLDDLLAFYRVHKSHSISSIKKTKLIKYHAFMFRELYHFNRCKSLLYSLINCFFFFFKKFFYRRRKRTIE